MKPSDRRSFLAKLSTTALGAGFSTHFALQNWDEIQGKLRTAKAELTHQADEVVAAVKEAAPTSAPAAAPEKPVVLPGETDYAVYLANLGLSFIAPHEVLTAHRRLRNGVANGLPPRQLWSRMAPSLKAADILRQRLGVKLKYIASAYRSPSYNAQCPGAAKRSYHMKNCALDLVYDCPPSFAIAEAKKMRKEGLFKGGLGEYSSFMHLDTRGYNASW